jgi:hypothetical protein
MVERKVIGTRINGMLTADLSTRFLIMRQCGVV